MTKRTTAGDRIVTTLTGALGDGLEWSEAEQVTLELLRKQVDTVATLETLMAAEVGSDNARPRLVAELAAELRLSRQAVAKYVAALPTDETPVKSERHQRAAQARWGTSGGELMPRRTHPTQLAGLREGTGRAGGGLDGPVSLPAPRGARPSYRPHPQRWCPAPAPLRAGRPSATARRVAGGRIHPDRRRRTETKLKSVSSGHAGKRRAAAAVARNGGESVIAPTPRPRRRVRRGDGHAGASRRIRVGTMRMGYEQLSCVVCKVVTPRRIL